MPWPRPGADGPLPLSAPEIVRTSLEIAGDICIYTNRNIDVVEVA